MNPSLQDQLKQWKKDHMKVKQERKSNPVKRKPVKKLTEKLSENDLKYLMGSNRKVLYRGKGGAYK